ncbi:MAG TPA: hypothetical protein VFW71_06985 [Actinomycetota bacterium]|nr:hypothetical protein [Actinomycetota bacterium]
MSQTLDTQVLNEPRRSLVAQWIAVLAPPGAWAAEFLLNYNLADSLGCSPSAIRFLGMDGGVKIASAAVTGVAVLVCLLTGALSLAAYRRFRAEDHTTGQRARWMALAGVMVAVLFLIIILASFLPIAILDPPCAPSM